MDTRGVLATCWEIRRISVGVFDLDRRVAAPNRTHPSTSLNAPSPASRPTAEDVRGSALVVPTACRPTVVLEATPACPARPLPAPGVPPEPPASSVVVVLVACPVVPDRDVAFPRAPVFATDRAPPP